MSYLKIAGGIYSVGVQNPNLRIFDIVMKTDYGTSYNAYVVKGSEKTALIDTVHLDFFDEYIENLKSLEIDSVDYIVVNHCEPDHSGALRKITEIYPEAKIIVSNAGKLYLQNIVNKDLEVIIPKDGEEIDLGGKTLKFFSAPFLHWPDSMFTLAKEDKVLFSCDFLGCHYCEPRMLDKYIKSNDIYAYSFRYYYNAIFGPFKPFVLKGVKIAEELEPEFICPSHGPIITFDNIKKRLDDYRIWSTPVPEAGINIPIFYASAYGCTGAMAENIKKGILNKIPKANVELFDLVTENADLMAQKLNSSKAFLIGSPTINRDAVFPCWNLISKIDAINSKNLSCAVFGSYGWSGEAPALLNSRLSGLKIKCFDKTLKLKFVPSDSEKEDCILFGEEFAEFIS